jgi:hypothetical protein
MSQPRIFRPTGDAMEQGHLHLPDAESGLRRRLHLCLAWHPPQPVTLPELNLLKSSICRPDIHIPIQLFPVRNIMVKMRLPSMILILFQIF